MTKPTKIVYSKKLANELVNLGFKLIKTEFNIENPRYKVFIFKNSDELEAKIEAYRQEYKKEG